MFHVEKKKNYFFLHDASHMIDLKCGPGGTRRGISFQNRFKDENEKELNCENEQ